MCIANFVWSIAPFHFVMMLTQQFGWFIFQISSGIQSVRKERKPHGKNGDWKSGPYISIGSNPFQQWKIKMAKSSMQAGDSKFCTSPATFLNHLFSVTISVEEIKFCLLRIIYLMKAEEWTIWSLFWTVWKKIWNVFKVSKL